MSWPSTLQDSRDGFKLVGNAFKVTGAAADIDDLKKVQTSNRFWRTVFGRALTKIECPCLQQVL